MKNIAEIIRTTTTGQLGILKGHIPFVTIIEIRPIISGNIINQPFAKKYFEVESHLYPNSEMADKYGFYFTCRPDLNKEEEIIIEKTLKALVNQLNKA